MSYSDIISAQRQFFVGHRTKSIEFRKEQLRKLKSVILQNEQALYDAIHQDFRKSAFDSFSTELSFVYSEINYYIRHLKRLSKPERVKTNLVNLWGTSRIYKEPLGVCLIVGAWNYPYQLTLLPAIAALAAGNTCIIKPSELATNSSNALKGIINKNFPAEYLHVIEGNAQQSSELLQNRFDKIFFTGSTRVGQIYYEAAAKHLTPITLELGGKSPAIISEEANLKVAAKRIVWGKFLNAGQTCIAPDYVCVHESIKEKFIAYLEEYIRDFDYNSKSEHFTQIVNDRHFERLLKLMDSSKIIIGGEVNQSERYISPTVMDGVTANDAVMQEEIFGPILPIMTYRNFNELIEDIAKKDKALSAYLFSNNSAEQKIFLENLSFGGGCINDTLMHISNTELPFGGIGASGMGNYHGKYGFDTFSHSKSVLHRATWGEPNLKYPPYTSSKFKWIKRLMK